jgi:HrpA-like RNA helicase
MRKNEGSKPAIWSARSELGTMIATHYAVIIIGEMGSGKSTLIPQLLFRTGFHRNGTIVCTEPRRVAVFTITKRVSLELGVELGGEVGYAVRFVCRTNTRTKVKYITDGLFLSDATFDPLFKKYSVVILDEAHERTVQTDVLLGLLKRTQYGRPDYFVILAASATLDAKKFSRYFRGAPCAYVLGKKYRLEVVYTKTFQPEILNTVLQTILKIHYEESCGDILVFLPGRNEIAFMGHKLSTVKKKYRLTTKLNILKYVKVFYLFSALPYELIVRALLPQKNSNRKVILATNIAETSLTLVGVRFVIDSGLAKTKIFSGRVGFELMNTIRISKPQAIQRCGRVGRHSPGKCFRVYPESFFSRFSDATVPEIRRCQFPSTVMKLKFLGIKNVLAFDFLEPPPLITIIRSLELLHILSSIDGTGDLTTDLGFKMSLLPIEPMLAKVLLISDHLNCSTEAAMIVSMIVTEGKPITSEHCQYMSEYGDHLTLLYIYQAFVSKTQRAKIDFCRQHAFNIGSLDKAINVNKQLKKLIERMNIPMTTCKSNLTILRIALTAGLFPNAAKRKSQEKFKSMASGMILKVHHSSSVLNHIKNLTRSSKFIIFSDHILTKTAYLREVSLTEEKWLYAIAPTFFNY